MRTAIIAAVSAVVAGLAAAFIALAIDDGGAATVVQEPAGESAEAVSAAADERDSPEAVADESAPPAPDLPPAEGDAPPRAEGPSADAGFDPVAIFEEVGPSVVSIESQGGLNSGSGFFVDDEGHIVTNYHVVVGSSTVNVVLDDGTELPGEVLGFDADNDLAVVRVEADGLVVRAVELGDSEALIVGEPVAAIGNPFGLERTLTTGIVSAVERLRPALQAGGRPQRGLIQTDAAINPGNSGGPLINAAGEVIGVNASVESPIRASVGVGFAIPSSVVSRFLPRLIAGDEIQHPWIGITGQDTEEGALVDSIVEGSPADQSGLQVGDLIEAIGGQAIGDFEQLAVLVDGFDVGETVPLAVVRDGAGLELALTLGAWPGLAG